MKRIWIIDKRTGEIILEKRFEELFPIEEAELKIRARKLLIYMSKKKFIDRGHLTYKIE